MTTKKRLLCIAAATVMAATADARLVLAAQVGSHMVLQQQTDARLWGKATPGATVSVKGDWMATATTAKAAADSTWLLTVRTPAASFAAHTLTISDSEGDVRRLDDVLIGEVWLASGQSNMEMPLNGFWNCPVNGSNEEIATAGEWAPRIRMATIPKTGATEPREWVEGQWQVPSPETAPWMSATAWFFAQMMTRTLQVPVGIIACAWGGASVEGWSPRQLLNTYGDVNLEEELKRGWNGQWWEYYTPLIMYNGMLHPMRHYTVRGFLWYQGEANVGKDKTYAERLNNMVRQWRSDFKGTSEQLPFYQVEIAPWAGYGDGDSSGLLRESQHRAAQLIPNSGIVSTVDLVEPWERNQIHPAEKQKVGQRLAYLALNRTYGMKNICCDSPKYDHIEIHGNEVEVFFKHADDGLSPWQDIVGFELCGSDGKYHEAQGRLNESHKSIVVTADGVAAPVAVRYCFRAFQPGNLHNHRNLPVAPFRSDDSH